MRFSKPPLGLPTHIIEGEVKISETDRKTEKIIAFIPYFYTFIVFHSDNVEQNCHVCYNTLQPQSRLSAQVMEEKPKIFEAN